MIDFKKLNPDFSNKVQLVLMKLLKQHGIKMVPYSGYRSLEEQAVLFCRGKPTRYITQMIELFQSKKREPFTIISYLLQKGLKEVVPDETDEFPIITRVLPGLSFHNWGLAVDCYYEHPETGKPIWKLNDLNLENEEYGMFYLKYTQIAKEFGLRSGYELNDFMDPNHIQRGEDIIEFLTSKKEVDFPEIEFFRNASLEDLERLKTYY